jgi:hypothetical protein
VWWARQGMCRIGRLCHLIGSPPPRSGRRATGTRGSPTAAAAVSHKCPLFARALANLRTIQVRWKEEEEEEQEQEQQQQQQQIRISIVKIPTAAQNLI